MRSGIEFSELPAVWWRKANAIVAAQIAWDVRVKSRLNDTGWMEGSAESPCAY